MENARALKVGDRVKVVSDTSAHRLTIGHVGKIVRVDPLAEPRFMLDNNPHGTFLIRQDLKLAVVSKEEVEEDIRRLKRELEQKATILKLMEDHGVSETTPDQIKVFQVLSILGRDDVSLEDAQTIADVLRE